eukprot:6176188-Pleurochrysis_carterae.AAC.4
MSDYTSSLQLSENSSSTKNLLQPLRPKRRRSGHQHLKENHDGRDAEVRASNDIRNCQPSNGIEITRGARFRNPARCMHGFASTVLEGPNWAPGAGRRYLQPRCRASGAGLSLWPACRSCQPGVCGAQWQPPRQGQGQGGTATIVYTDTYT